MFLRFGANPEPISILRLGNCVRILDIFDLGIRGVVKVGGSYFFRIRCGGPAYAQGCYTSPTLLISRLPSGLRGVNDVDPFRVAILLVVAKGTSAFRRTMPLDYRLLLG